MARCKVGSLQRSMPSIAGTKVFPPRLKLIGTANGPAARCQRKRWHHEGFLPPWARTGVPLLAIMGGSFDDAGGRERRILVDRTYVALAGGTAIAGACTGDMRMGLTRPITYYNSRDRYARPPGQGRRYVHRGADPDNDRRYYVQEGRRRRRSGRACPGWRSGGRRYRRGAISRIVRHLIGCAPGAAVGAAVGGGTGSGRRRCPRRRTGDRGLAPIGAAAGAAICGANPKEVRTLSGLFRTF